MTGQSQRLQDYRWRILFLAEVSHSHPLYLSNYSTPESDPVFKTEVMQWSTEAQMAYIYFETFTPNTSPLELFYLRKSVSDQGPIVLGAVPKKENKDNSYSKEQI